LLQACRNLHAGPPTATAADTARTAAARLAAVASQLLEGADDVATASSTPLLVLGWSSISNCCFPGAFLVELRGHTLQLLLLRIVN